MSIDFERFRLRNFLDTLVAQGECVIHQAPIDLIDVAGKLDEFAQAVWFKAAGGAELVGNVMASRRRLAMAFGVDEANLPRVLRERAGQEIAPTEVSSAEAPVHQVVKLGGEADLCALPVHLQHELDGAPYISASIDYARDPSTGGTNMGCRRMMLRGRQTAGVDLNAPSDLRAIYQAAHKRGERVEVAYVVGAHPIDFLAATFSSRAADELALNGALRGASVPVVKCKTIDVRVPADAEYVLEGYLDSAGFSEAEGPYGEYLGYYGHVKRNPVFHLTAITHRADAVFQTITIGGPNLTRTDTAQLVAAKTASTVWTSLLQAVREPVAVCCTASCGGMYNVRVSLRQRYPGEARNAIAAAFASVADIKHVFVVDEDIDVFDDGQIDWALATRFQADRDIVVGEGFRAVPIDPSLEGRSVGAKAGFDCTKPFGAAAARSYVIPTPPKWPGSRHASVMDALNAGPATFLELMAAAGSRDGRDVVRALDPLYAAGRVARTDDGRYRLVP